MKRLVCAFVLVCLLPSTGTAFPQPDERATLAYGQCMDAAGALPEALRAHEEKRCRQALGRSREFTAQGLWDQFNTDMITAEERWHDRIVCVSGVVTGLGDSTIGGYPEVHMSFDGFGTRGVRCRFPASARTLVMDLQSGQQITVLGVCKGFVRSDLLLIDSCEMLEDPPATAPEQSPPVPEPPAPRNF